ncbi:MAG TPA: RsmE family RNA methyltransferase [Ilumatobacteraceae bacterium]|nr:RsmE family RNA methyltransferase [Ilumatobacteraceae bacterium]
MNSALRQSAAHVFVESLTAPVLDDGDRHHLGRVLRLRVGQVVSVSDGRGSWLTCRYEEDGELQPSSAVIAEPIALPQLTVGFVAPKGDRPEWIVQKLTEIGIDRIVVLRSDRGVVRWADDRAERQLDRLRRVAREAAMQSRRVWLPEIDGPTPITTLRGQTAALAEPDGATLTLATPTVLIGPEGGWTAAESAQFERHCRLGSTILRTETAAVVAAAQLAALRDSDVQHSC